jgi:hypothetical protein
LPIRSVALDVVDGENGAKDQLPFKITFEGGGLD